MTSDADNPPASSCPSPDSMKARWRARLMLAAFACLAWGSGLWTDYAYDDVTMIVECDAIDDFANVPLLFSKRFGPVFGDLNWRPLAPATYFLDAALFGKTPFFSFFFNLALHVAAGWALFGLWMRVFRREGLAFAAALFFLVHPLASEVVLCAGFRRDILALLFGVLTVRLGLVWLDSPRPRPGALAATALCLWLGLLAKEPAATALALGALALAVRPELRAAPGEWLRLHRTRLAALVLAGGAVLGLWTALYLSLGPDVAKPPPVWEGGAALGFLNFCRSWVLYARLWIWPFGLSIVHAPEVSRTFGDPRLWSAFAAFAAFAAIALLAFLRRPGPFALGAVWSVVAFAPAMQLFPTPQLTAERYAYFPLAGAGLAFAALLARGEAGASVCALWDWRRAWPRKGAILAVALFWCGAAMWRAADWRDNLTLNLRSWEQRPGAQSRIAEGALLWELQRREEAIAAVREATRLAPENAEGWRLLGLFLGETGETEASAEALTRAETLAPDHDAIRRTREYLESRQ